MKLFTVFLIAPLVVAFLPATCAQAATPTFQPGEWQVHSTVTPSSGKPVQRNMSVCAKNASQTWQTHTPNQKCSNPMLTAISNGYNIKLTCNGGTGPVHWKSVSNINELFSNQGYSFQANGTMTTTVSYAGHAPITSSAKLLATGRHIGGCK